MDHAPRDMELLTPGGSMRWGRCQFDFNPSSEGPADYVIVLGNARQTDYFFAAPENTLFIAAEPLNKKIYAKSFYQQFARVVDTHAQSGHSRVTTTALGLCWHVGLDQSTGAYRYGYDHLKTLARPRKLNSISVVCSDAAFTPGQRLRLEFLKRLKKRLGDRMVHYGRGFEPIDDKMDAILPHRFHLALENCEVPHYWTEKVADAYLGWGFPFYVGCPNLADYFQSESFTRLDPRQADAAADLILRRLESPGEENEEVLVGVARQKVLDVYNPFARSAYWAEMWHMERPPRRLTIRSHKAFRSLARGLIYRLRRLH